MAKPFITQKIDITGWNKTIRGLQKIKGGTFKDILNAECAEILSITANRKATRSASREKIVKRHMSVNTFFLGYKGGKEAYTLKSGEAGVTKQTTYYLHHKLPNKVWNYILPKMQKRTQKHFGNYGLNKGQFALMASKLGFGNFSKPFPSEANRFLKLRRNVIDSKVLANTKGKNDLTYKITLESYLSKVISFAGGAKTFKSVMRSRVKKFEKALGKGVMQDIKKRTKQYPLIFS